MAGHDCAVSGGSYLDIAPLFGVSTDGFYESMLSMLQAIVDQVPVEYSFQQENLEAITRGLMDRQKTPVFKHTVGSLDGILIQLKWLSIQEVTKPVAFWTHKGYYSLNMQAVCNTKLIWHFVSIDCLGTAHDSTAVLAAL